MSADGWGEDLEGSRGLPKLLVGEREALAAVEERAENFNNTPPGIEPDVFLFPTRAASYRSTYPTFHPKASLFIFTRLA